MAVYQQENRATVPSWSALRLSIARILLIAIYAGVMGLAMITIFLRMMNHPTLVSLMSINLSNSPPATAPIFIQSSTPTTIDKTEDIKAMGYPDGRKSVRDAAGNLYVAYRKKYKLHYHTAYHIFVAKSTNNGRSWNVLNQGRPIETTGDQNQRVPAIAIDSQGALHVVWYGRGDHRGDKGNGPAANQIKYVYSTNQGESWSAWRNIAYVTGYDELPHRQRKWQEHPAIYVAPNDDLYVVWEGLDRWHPEAVQVKLIKSTDGGKNWSLWKNINPTQTNRSRPTIVGTPQGTLFILAYGRLGTKQQILYTQSTDGGHLWRRWQPVSPSAVEQRHVSAVADQHGVLHVVWRQLPVVAYSSLRHGNDHAKTQIYYATLSETAAEHNIFTSGFLQARWSKPMRIQASQRAQTFPSIGIAHSAEPHHRVTAAEGQAPLEDVIWIVWSETADSYNYPNDQLATGRIYAITKTAQRWSRPILLTEGNENIYASLARTANSASSPIDVVWLANSRESKQIQFAQLTSIPLSNPGSPNQSTLHRQAAASCDDSRAVVLPQCLQRMP